MAKGIYFSCPDCQTRMSVSAVVRSETDRILLIAECPECESEFKFDIEGIIKGLYPPKGKSPRGN